MCSHRLYIARWPKKRHRKKPPLSVQRASLEIHVSKLFEDKHRSPVLFTTRVSKSRFPLSPSNLASQSLHPSIASSVAASQKCFQALFPSVASQLCNSNVAPCTASAIVPRLVSHFCFPILQPRLRMGGYRLTPIILNCVFATVLSHFCSLFTLV